MGEISSPAQEMQFSNQKGNGNQPGLYAIDTPVCGGHDFMLGKHTDGAPSANWLSLMCI